MSRSLTAARGPALGPGPEFDRIRGIARRLGDHARGLGDDCAMLPDGGGTLALSTDVSVEGVHFRLEWIEPGEVGWRATAAALSDLAAVGAEAVGVLSAITVPAAALEEDLVALAGGIGDAASAAGGAVLGGDLSAGPVWSVAVTVIGRAECPVTGSGSRVRWAARGQRSRAGAGVSRRRRTPAAPSPIRSRDSRRAAGCRSMARGRCST